jgi:WD40 repeat protein
VRLWDTATGVCDFILNAHENWVRCVFFHPSYKYIISCSDDKSIRVFEVKVSSFIFVCLCELILFTHFV